MSVDETLMCSFQVTKLNQEISNVPIPSLLLPHGNFVLLFVVISCCIQNVQSHFHLTVGLVFVHDS